MRLPFSALLPGLLAAALAGALSGPASGQAAPAQSAPAQSALAPAATAPAATAPAATALSGAQRAEVVGLLRDTLRRDPSILRDALAALQADDDRRQDAAQAEALARLAGTLVDPADPVAGNPAADVTLVEFYDTRCPYCRTMMATTEELLRTDPGVRIVFKDLPVLGPASRLEARALLAAQRQGGYARMQAAVMRSAAPPTREGLRAEAGRQGLDGAALLRDMDDPAVQARLDANMTLARQVGLQGTPAIVGGTRMLAGAVGLQELRGLVADVRARR